MNHVINDGFMNPDRFGYAAIPFKISDKEPRKDVPIWRIRRTNARSMGKRFYEHTKPCKCGSLLRRVYNNECFDCWKLENKK
ncbi:AB1gp57 [Acinetobacter phage AB1]|uniref:AB1gp57 n=1 Tax=Acinetobacter phage AB1 TaxID=889876 RepID=E2GLZ5_9CAUD|nr:AB1gp57 [Acinetobacter phage AB1]ADO14428.1 AB1gp57 [Acinetobacter phage AB1]